jgi:hypothetical protein
MALVLAQDYRGVVLVDDQNAIEKLATDAADGALGYAIGRRCPHGRLRDADVDRGEHGVEGGGELGCCAATMIRHRPWGPAAPGARGAAQPGLIASPPIAAARRCSG